MRREPFTNCGICGTISEKAGRTNHGLYFLRQKRNFRARMDGRRGAVRRGADRPRHERVRRPLRQIRAAPERARLRRRGGRPQRSATRKGKCFPIPSRTWRASRSTTAKNSPISSIYCSDFHTAPSSRRRSSKSTPAFWTVPLSRAVPASPPLRCAPARSSQTSAVW